MRTGSRRVGGSRHAGPSETEKRRNCRVRPASVLLCSQGRFTTGRHRLAGTPALRGCVCVCRIAPYPRIPQMVALVLSVALALVPHGGRPPGHLPAQGLVIPGVSFAGVRIGDTSSASGCCWGADYQTCKYCADPTWLYEYQGASRSGPPSASRGKGRRRVLARVARRLADEGACTWATRSRTSTSTTRGPARRAASASTRSPRGRASVDHRVLQRGGRHLRVRDRDPVDDRLPVALSAPAAQRLTCSRIGPFLPVLSNLITASWCGAK